VVVMVELMLVRIVVVIDVVMNVGIVIIVVF